MSIVLPILLFVVCIGLFAPRMTPRWWILIVIWILVVLAYNYLKPYAIPIPTSASIGFSRIA